MGLPFLSSQDINIPLILSYTIPQSTQHRSHAFLATRIFVLTQQIIITTTEDKYRSFKHLMAHFAIPLAYSAVNMKSNGDKASPCFRYYTYGKYLTGVYVDSHKQIECVSERWGYATFEKNFEILGILVHVT
jgi:hypothetical protein